MFDDLSFDQLEDRIEECDYALWEDPHNAPLLEEVAQLRQERYRRYDTWPMATLLRVRDRGGQRAKANKQTFETGPLREVAGTVGKRNRRVAASLGGGRKALDCGCSAAFGRLFQVHVRRPGCSGR
jgi:hypothetical protein